MAQLGAELPAVLAAALSIDNAQRKLAEARIATLSKDPALVPALVEQLRLAPDAQVRQLAAILLRRRTLSLWLKLPEPTRDALKAALVDAIVREPRCVQLRRCTRAHPEPPPCHAAPPCAARQRTSSALSPR